VEGIHVTGILGTGLSLNYGSFEEVSVGTAAHSAEWPVPGVQMQFVVKSGGNQNRGVLYADMASHGWQSFNIDDHVGGGEGSGVVVRIRSRSGCLGSTGQLSRQAPSDALDQRHRQGHVPTRPHAPARRVRPRRMEP
jgi:hypothetical protein